MSVVIEEMTEAFKELDDDVYALHKRLDRLETKFNYWLKKLKD